MDEHRLLVFEFAALIMFIAGLLIITVIIIGRMAKQSLNGGLKSTSVISKVK